MKETIRLDIQEDSPIELNFPFMHFKLNLIPCQILETSYFGCASLKWQNAILLNFSLFLKASFNSIHNECVHRRAVM